MANRGLQLLSEIVVDVQGPVMKESGGALGEDRGRDEEGEIDGVTALLGSSRHRQPTRKFSIISTRK